jgi:hypothetical protein
VLVLVGTVVVATIEAARGGGCCCGDDCGIALPMRSRVVICMVSVDQRPALGSRLLLLALLLIVHRYLVCHSRSSSNAIVGCSVAVSGDRMRLGGEHQCHIGRSAFEI